VGHTCLSLGYRDPWVVASSSYMSLAAILGGPTSTLALSSGKHSSSFSQAFYFLHRVLFGGPSEEVLCATGLGCAKQEEGASDSSDLEEPRAGKGRYKRGVGAIPQREPKRLKRSRQTIVYPRRVLLVSAAGSAKSGVPDILSPSCLAGHGMGENLDVPQRLASLRAQQDKRQVVSIRKKRMSDLLL
jgi:hypothetical protein